MDWKTLLPVLLEAAKAALDAVVNGKEINEDFVSVIRIAYVAALEYYDEIAELPNTTWPKDALDDFIGFCEDTAAEGEWALYELPA